MEATIAGKIISASAKTRRLLAIVLYSLCVIMTASVIFNAVSYCSVIGEVPQNALNDQGVVRFIVVELASVLSDALFLIAFFGVTTSVVRKHEFFSKKQTARMMIMGAALLLQTVFGLLLPTLTLPAPELSSDTAVLVQPVLDLRMLSFSLMFFALAGIFEYGRILQQDSDDII